MSECKIKSFRASWSPWDISRPGGGCNRGTWTIRLPVTFTLELAEGSTKADCIVGQEKRGRSEVAGNAGGDVWNTFEADSDLGRRYWWDGKILAGAGKGNWNSAGTVATFEDKPGFDEAPAGQSLYYGGNDQGKNGYFDFKTFVKDLASDKIIQEINWSMRIVVQTSNQLEFWWSFSDQK